MTGGCYPLPSWNIYVYLQMEFVVHGYEKDINYLQHFH
jgi:hypothetical protein